MDDTSRVFALVLSAVDRASGVVDSVIKKANILANTVIKIRLDASPIQQATSQMSNYFNNASGSANVLTQTATDGMRQIVQRTDDATQSQGNFFSAIEKSRMELAATAYVVDRFLNTSLQTAAQTSINERTVNQLLDKKNAPEVNKWIEAGRGSQYGTTVGRAEFAANAVSMGVTNSKNLESMGNLAAKYSTLMPNLGMDSTQLVGSMISGSVRGTKLVRGTLMQRFRDIFDKDANATAVAIERAKIEANPETNTLSDVAKDKLAHQQVIINALNRESKGLNLNTSITDYESAEIQKRAPVTTTVPRRWRCD